jgi:hypothetical protein
MASLKLCPPLDSFHHVTIIQKWLSWSFDVGLLLYVDTVVEVYWFILFTSQDCLHITVVKSSYRVDDSLNHVLIRFYIIDQGYPCPLVTLNPFGRKLLLSDVSTGIKWSTWIERSIMNMNMTMRVCLECETT